MDARWLWIGTICLGVALSGCADESDPVPLGDGGSSTAGTGAGSGMPTTGTTGSDVPATSGGGTSTSGDVTGTSTAGTAGTTATGSGLTGLAGGASGLSGATGGSASTSGGAVGTSTGLSGGTTDATGDPPAMTDAGMGGGEPMSGASCLMGSGDFNDDGPYSVQKEDVTIGSSGPFTIFYPSPLEEGCLHPVVAWGNGTGVTGSGTYAFYNEHAASWGMVVIASHNSNVGSGDFHVAGLDYLYEQNADPSSKFFGKLSEKAGTSGHSQGGMGANAGARHGNVVAIGNVQGAFGRAPQGKAFLCLTGTEDIAIEGCKGAVNGTSSPALYANWQGGTHTGTATIGGWLSGDAGSKQYRRLYSAWFRCFLAEDANACAMFEGGASCPVCQDSGWAEIFANNY